MLKMKALLTASLLLGLSFSTALHAAKYGKENASVEIIDTESEADKDLAKNAQSTINSGWFTSTYDQVTVKVVNGVVILGGSVKTNADKEKIEREVRAINGVKQVTNSIVVLDPKAQ